MLKIKYLKAKIKLHIELQVNKAAVTSFLKYTLLCYLVHYCILSFPS
jgi:hypothetical protein